MRRVFILVFLLAFWAFSASAQIEISSGLGYFMPVSDTKDIHLGSYLVGGNVGFYVSPRFCIGAEIFYHELGLTDADQEFIDLEEIEVGKSLTNFCATAKFLFNTGSTSLYTKYVAGSYEYKENVIEDNDRRVATEKNIGVGAGIGLQFQSAGFFGGFIEGVYNHVFLESGDALDYVDFRAGIILKGY